MTRALSFRWPWRIAKLLWPIAKDAYRAQESVEARGPEKRQAALLATAEPGAAALVDVGLDVKASQIERIFIGLIELYHVGLQLRDLVLGRR